MTSEPMPPLSEDDLHRLVQTFYGRIRQDALLGPIFNGAIDDWDHHLGKLQAFWSSVMLGSGRYKGQPMAVHLRQEAHMTPEAFARWLQLWNETTADLLDPLAARALQEKAARIAESLTLGIAFAKDRGIPA
jgi:hemoglobin